MKILVYSITEGKEYPPYVIKVENLTEIAIKSDFISIHCASSGKTKGLIDRNFLQLTKKDCILINTARGDIINDEDLIEHLNSNPKFLCGIDTFRGEPTANGETEFLNVLAKHPQVIGTHHIAGNTDSSLHDMSEEIIRIIIGFDNGIDINRVT